MSTATPRPELFERCRFAYRFPRPVEISLTALVLALAAAVSVRVLVGAEGPPDSVVFRLASGAWLTLLLLFPWLMFLRVLQDRASVLAAGEILGIYMEVFALGIPVADWLAPEGPLKLSWAFLWYPFLVVMFLLSCWKLGRTALGRRRRIRHRVADAVGLVLIVGFGILLTVGWALAPPAL